MKNKLLIKAMMVGLFLLSGSVNAANFTEITWCVFDPVGTNGPSKEMVDEYKVAALRWNVKLNTKHYTDDQEAKKAFDAGTCDLVYLPDFRVRKYNHFTGSISAVGSIPSYNHMGTIIKSLSSPAAEKVMVNGDYEVYGIFLIGGVHGFVKDRSWVTPEHLEGKKISLLDGIEESDYFNEKLKMIGVKSDLGTVFNNFNNGVVDMTIAPLIVYEGLEMSKGLGGNGGISRYPLTMITMQLIARKSAFPTDVGQKSRTYATNYHPKMVRTVKSYEDKVPESYYFDVPLEIIYYFDNLFTRARKDLTEQGIYNEKMLKLMKKVRCQSYPDRAEC